MKRICYLGLGFLMAGCLYGQIFVNQVGYHPEGEKPFWTNIAADSFSLFEAGSQTLVFRDKLHLFTHYDPATGMSLYTGDFTPVHLSGQFYIQLDDGSISPPVNISTNTYNQVHRQALKGFYFQRCGLNLTGTHAGNYYHPACHTLDATHHTSSGVPGFRPTAGGWHDAGDYGKYTVNAGISVGTLLMAHEWFPHLFSDDDLNIPESGNGIPDILDESRYELEWLLKMQDSDGGVFHKLTAEQFPPFIMPQYHSDPRFIYQKSSAATADFVAVMARAARVFAPYDSSFAAACLSAGELGWQFLQNHPNIVPPGGFQNPPGTNTGEYGDNDDRDERLWAAIELFETTADSIYYDYFLNHYSTLGFINGPFWWQNVKGLALLTYLKSQHISPNDVLKAQIRNSLDTHCQQLLMRIAGNGFGVSLLPGEYVWGCNSTVLNNAIYLILNYMETENEIYLKAASKQLNYILGTNAHHMSFVTGVGTRFPLHPHHRPSEADGVTDPVPGLLVGGPDQYLSDPVLQAHFTSATPPALCYLDTVVSYASNEIAINWNAPLVFVSGLLRWPDAIVKIKSNIREVYPHRIQIKPNFPNPFNGTTRIRFSLNTPGMVTFILYNILGEKLLAQNMGFFPAGQHEMRVDLWALKGQSLASGIYFYQLLTEYPSEIGKMVYIR